ncbi:MAG: GatB/YqeY domain-containing protein [Candidatus Omnitrophica bacterium]|nr:GatB/YqeY domain-containing protein [Candidatus Omnitrophota bacterium]
MMATLAERLESDYRSALKAGERLRVDALRLIKAGIQRVAIEKRKESLEDQEILQVIAQQAKQRRETIGCAKQTKRDDVVGQATAELALLNSYLPQQLSEDALKQLIEEAVKAVGSIQGQVMKHVMGKAAGAADGKVVSRLVAERLKKP